VASLQLPGMEILMGELYEIAVQKFSIFYYGLAQDIYRWRALVNSVMNLRVP
jgi:hypothetical protein